MNERERMAAAAMRAKELRWKFLFELYTQNKQVPAGQSQQVAAADIARQVGITDPAEVDQIYTYLADAGLVELLTFGPTLRITHAGIVEVEESLQNPAEETAHLPPLITVIYNVIHGGVHGSTVQQGTTSSQQTVDNSTAVDWESLRAILRDIRTNSAGLPAEDREELIADIDTLEAQSLSPRPKAAVVGACLLAVKAVLANTAGNIVAAPFIAWMDAHHWLWKSIAP